MGRLIFRVMGDGWFEDFTTREEAHEVYRTDPDARVMTPVALTTMRTEFLATLKNLYKEVK